MRYLRVAVVGLLTWGAGVSAHADYKSTVLSKNPIGYWQLNETTPIPVLVVATNYGSAGTTGNGAYQNGATTEPTPIAGKAGETAAKFDGISQKVQVPYNPELNPTNELSVEAWVRPECIDTWNTSWARAIVSTFGGNSQGGGYKLMFNAGTTTTPDVFKFTLWNGSSGTETFAAATTAGTILATNNGPWFHVAGTWSSADGIAHLYVNGVELASASRTYNPTTSSPLRIAATDTDPTDPVGASMDPGAIAHVAVYNTALTPDRILAHYQAGTNAAANYSGTVITDSPVGYWKLNETSFPAMPVATNLGTKGAALNGTYGYASTPGRPGALAPNYSGFSSTNVAVYTTNTALGGGGLVWFPPMRTTTDPINVTVVAWIKRDGSQMPFANVFGRRINSYAKSAFGFDGGGLNKLGYNWDDNASQYNFDSKLTVPDNVWTLAAWVITPTNTVMYMDTGTGLQSVTNTFANTTTLGLVHQTFIGTTGGNYQGRRFNGLVDELAVWNTSLSAADIWDLRNAAFAGSAPFIAGQSGDRPVMLGGKAPFTLYVGSDTNFLPITGYQLLKDGVASGAVSSSPTVTYNNVQAADLASTFKVVASTASGSMTSSPVGLTRWTVPGSYSEVVESYRPAAYYRFKETSGKTAYEIAQGADAGVFNLAAQTNGPQPTTQVGFESGNVGYNIGTTVGYIASLTPVITTNTVTITAWINPSSINEVTRGIYFSRGAGYAGFNFSDVGGNQLDITWNGHYNVNSGVYAYANEWNFVAMAVTPTDVTFYCYNLTAGWQMSTVTLDFPTPNLAGATTGIGTDPSNLTARSLTGQIDEVAVFNQTLALEDIQKIASAGFNVHLSIERASANAERVSWSYGTLQWANAVTGPYTDVPGAVAPSFIYTNAPGTGQKYFESYHIP